LRLGITDFLQTSFECVNDERGVSIGQGLRGYRRVILVCPLVESVAHGPKLRRRLVHPHQGLPDVFVPFLFQKLSKAQFPAQ